MARETNDFDDLKRAMDAATPAPDAARRAANLARATDIFVKTQESRKPARQSSDRPDNRGLIRGLIDMLKANTFGALTGTTALIAVGFLVLTPGGQELWRTPAQFEPQIFQEPFVVEAPDASSLAGDAEVLPAQTALEQAATTPPPTPSPAASPVAPEVRPSGPSDGIVFDVPATPLNDLSGGLLGFGNSVIIQEGVGNSGQNFNGYGNSATTFGAVPEARVRTLDTVAPAPADTEAFANADPNPLRVVTEDPVSTFSADVDTAAYSLIRQSIESGRLPPVDAVRIEEMVNYFPYAYPAPEPGAPAPFLPTVSVFETPWNADTQLLHIGIQGILPQIEDRPPLNLVFLIDTSGSMSQPDKLPLLIQSFRLLLGELRAQDEVAIVTYAGTAGVALEPTAASDRAAINAALTALQAGGSTNGVGGLEEAYRLAAEMSDEGDVSRVLLATDGDFNVGLSDPSALEDYIAEQRDSGTYLSVLGFGRGNLQDATMQALAQNGNGIAAYIDSLHEAQRVLVDQFAGALFPLADDLKIQVEFNPEVIAEYRLIGYETRGLAREDFANDAVDAGELGAGHAVTAIYEVTPVGSPAQLVAPLRYAAEEAEAETTFADELGFISLRWKAPGAEDSQLQAFPIAAGASDPGTEAQFAAAIAGFGQLLQGSDFLGDWGYSEAIALANGALGPDRFGHRAEAVRLMRLAETLAQQ